jgi:hypothetical protein
MHRTGSNGYAHNAYFPHWRRSVKCVTFARRQIIMATQLGLAIVGEGSDSNF